MILHHTYMFPNLETHASFVVFREGLMESESEKSVLSFLLVISIPVTLFKPGVWRLNRNRALFLTYGPNFLSSPNILVRLRYSY